MSNRTQKLYIIEKTAIILNRLVTFLKSKEIESYVVGGYIRDGLLGNMSQDIDFAVVDDAVSIAKKVADIFNAKFVLLNEMHQIARVIVIQGKKRWYLDFTMMKKPIESDLCKRDFTINAIGVKLDQFSIGWNQVKLIDPLDGIDDIKQKIIRVTHDAVFINDPVRLLRAFRIAAELNFSINYQTEELIRRDHKQIAYISTERVRDELVRILNTNNSAGFLQSLHQTGILGFIIPELYNLREILVKNKQQRNILVRSFDTVTAIEHLITSVFKQDDSSIPSNHSVKLSEYFNQEIVIGRTRKALLKLAALLHNIIITTSEYIVDKKVNKPLQIQKSDYEYTNTIITVLARLKLSSREQGIIINSIKQHIQLKEYIDISGLSSIESLYKYLQNIDNINVDAVVLSLADLWANQGLQQDESNKGYIEIIDYIHNKNIQNSSTYKPSQLMNGYDLINHFGLKPGPKIGELLESIREAQISGEITTKEDAMHFIRSRLKNKSDV